MSLAEASDPKLQEQEGSSWLEEREAERRTRLLARQQLLRANRTTISPTPVRTRTRKPAPAHPVPDLQSGSTPIRLRLDPVDMDGEYDVDKATTRCQPQKPNLVLRALGPYLRFYKECPHCRCEEIYPVTWKGLFIERQFHRNPLVQRLRCERCLKTFVRPGWALGALPAPMRPRGLYD